MSEPVLREPTDDMKKSIEEMRSGFQSEFLIHRSLYAQQDFNRLFHEDWHVLRYLMASNDNPEAGLKRLINSMKWRKERGVWDITEKDFPKEFFEMIRFGKAKDGSTLVITRAQYYIHVKGWQELWKKFYIFVLEWLDRHDTGEGVTILIDCNSSTLSNVDFDFIWFIKPIQSKYYPFLIRKQLICDIPLNLMSVSQLIRSLMPEKTRKIILFLNDCRQLKEYIRGDNIPIYMGGTGDGLRPWTPESDCLSVTEFGKRFNYSEKSIKKICSHLRPLFFIYNPLMRSAKRLTI